MLEDLEDRYDIESARESLSESDERIPWERVKTTLGL